MKNSSYYSCTNIAFATYLVMKGYPVEHLEVERAGKGIFHFDIDTDTLNRIKCDWGKSTEAKFNARLNQLKSMTY